jgi:hypothetical protein
MKNLWKKKNLSLELVKVVQEMAVEAFITLLSNLSQGSKKRFELKV